MHGRHDGRSAAGVVGLPGLGGAGLGIAGGEDLLEHFAARRRRVAGQALRVALVDDDVGAVGVAAAAHRDVDVFAAHAGGGDGVGLVDGHALGAGDGRGVAKFDVVGDVVGREPDGGRVGVAGGAYAEGSVGQDGGDVPEGAVADEPVGGVEAAVVAAGDDAVADAGRQPVMEGDARGGRGPGSDAVDADAGVELADGPVVDRL